MVTTEQSTYIEEKFKEANLGHLFEVIKYEGNGLSVSFVGGSEERLFASINMGIAPPGVIYHFTANPTDYADEKTNEAVRIIIDESFSVFPPGTFPEIPDESFF